MNPEQIVSSLELAKKLKELKVEQDSFFYYCNIDGEGKYYVYNEQHLPEEDEYKGDPISAFTANELLELIEIEQYCSLKLIKTKSFDGNYYEVMHDYLNEFFTDENPSDCLAKMLIYLIENRHIKNE